jgi:hypothetical protein
MKRILILIAVLAIAGCAATSKTQVKHGKKGLHINCSGLSSSWDKCYTSAANSCAPKSYPFGLNPAGYTSRSMIVICK